MFRKEMFNEACPGILETSILVTKYIHKNINACNSSDKTHNYLFAPLVKIVQDNCDEILGQSDMSSLEKITLCAQEVKKYGAGNCLLQCYLEFDYLMKAFALTGLSTYQKCVPLAIWTTANHAFLVVADKYICDPLFGTVTLLDNKKKSGAKEYFGVRRTWQCYTNFKNEDTASTEYTNNLFTELLNADLSFISDNLAQEILPTSSPNEGSNLKTSATF